MVTVVAVGWGTVVLFAGRAVAHWGDARARARALSSARRTSGRAARRFSFSRLFDALGPVARVARGVARTRQRRRHDAQMASELPATIDLLAVAVSAGATPYGAIETAGRWAPPTVGTALGAVLDACRFGATFEAALRQCAQRTPPLRPLTTVLATGARLGAPVNDALARLAAESRRDLRRRSEARARTVPVRLLFPLVFLVLPAFGLLTVVPAVAAGFHGI